MLAYHNDNIIKFGYNPVLNSSLVPLNAVGATLSASLRSLDYTPSDANTIYVSKLTGNDDNAGTSALKVATLARAAIRCIAAAIHDVMICDSEIYEEWMEVTAGGIHNVHTQLGCKPMIMPAFNKDWYSISSMITEKDLSATVRFGNPYCMYSVSLLNGNTVFIWVQQDGAGISFEIRDKDGTIVKSAAEIHATNTDIACAIPLSNGNWCVLTKPSSYINVTAQVFSSSGVSVVNTTLDTAGLSVSSVFLLELSNGNLVCVFRTGTTGYFKMYDASFSEILTSSTMSNLSSHHACIMYDKTKWARFYSLTNPRNSYFAIHDSTGGVLSTNQFETGNAITVYDMIYLHNGRVLIIYCKDGDSYVLWARLFNENGSAFGGEYRVSNDPYTGYGISHVSRCIQLPDHNIYIHYQTTNCTWTILNCDLSDRIKSNTNYGYDPGQYEFTCINLLSEGNIFVFRSTGSGQRKLAKYGDFSYPGIKLSTTSKLHGIKISSGNIIGMKNLIEGANALEMKWCTIEDSISPHPSIKIRAVNITGSLVFHNSILKNIDEGIHAASNTVDVKDSQFVRVLADYGLTVTGAGAGISVNHCDFARSNGGLKLVGNNGSEVIKNSIFYMMGLFSIHTETAVPYHYSINTSPVHNAIAGTSIIAGNPHYINDGSITLDDLNLNLRTKFLGYLFNSPALALADDGGNAGSLEVDYGDVSQTWTYITIDKGTINVKYNPVGEVKTEYRDGSVGTCRDAFTEVLEITWDAIRNADFASILQMYFCEKSTIRVYPDPVTNPNGYNTYSLVYNSLAASPKKVNRLSRSGVQGVVLQFERAHNEGA